LITEPAEPAGLRLVPALCPICEVEDVDPTGVGEDFEYGTSPDTFLAVTCRRCSLLYLAMRPAESEGGRIYPDNYHAFHFNPAEFGLAYKVRRWLEAKRLRRWTRGLPADARILDVGCGDGFHLRLLRENGNPGWTLEGVDADPRAVAAAKGHGLTVHAGNVEDLGLSPGYHLAVMVMIIEHVPDPAALLKTVRGLLAPGGRLVVVTDNAGSPDAKIFGGRHWGGYHFPRHFHLFTRKTLAAAAIKAGLEPERVVTSVSPVNWVYSFRNWFQDWGAPRWVVNRFSLSSAPAMGVFTLADIALAYLGRGGNLQAVLRNPNK